MKRLLICALAVMPAFAADAKGLDLPSRIMLQHQAVEAVHGRMTVDHTPVGTVKRRVAQSPVNQSTTMGFVKMADGADRSDLEAAGFNVLAVRGRIAIVGLPTDSAETMAANPAVAKLSLQRPVKTNLAASRAVSGVDDIHAGRGLDVPYTGRGVLTCIVDQGVDPNHVAFLDEKGKSRVTYLTAFDGTTDKYGTPNYRLYGDEIYDIDDSGNIYWYPTVDKFETDELQTYHGTHTMNILAGGYKGDVEVGIGLSGLSPVLQTVSNPFYGVATDAQIAVSCGSLQDACIAYGINGLLDYASYAREVAGMPSVLSLSLGSTAGPHDPKGLMNQFLEECGDETIIVLAAGNEGDLKLALNKTMAGDDTSMASMVYPYGFQYDPKAGAPSWSNTYIRNGAVMVYSADGRPFTLRAFIMTGEEGNYRRRATYDISSENGEYFLSSNAYANYVGGTVNSTVARYFDGYIGGGSMLDEDLGRYYGVFDYYLYTNPETGINEDGSEAVIVGFEVVGQDGQRIECYCDGSNTWIYNYGMAGYLDGQRDGTISDMAVGHNVLVVGAWTAADSWTSLDGKRYGYTADDGIIVGDIGPYSSFGTLTDGRTLPHVCAPGTGIISAMSTPYVDSYFHGYEQYIPMNFQARATAGGKTYYWKSETGTSMSTPFVAGSIALWLEADPTLTIDDVIDIATSTARRDEAVEGGNPVQWCAGKFDALAGLKDVIKRAGVQSVTTDDHNNR
ncbi:MAG: S8 family serine peptidase, partial [Muribaculaceae bacterium]|nr:S8 family serine peptidase [Muribaculaceae bacterium]